MEPRQKGVNPLVATALLMVLVMAMGGILWGWTQNFWHEKEQSSDYYSGESVDCVEAGFRVLKDKGHCFFYGAGSTTDTNQVKVVVENTGEIDLNTFNITSNWADGSSDLNVLALNLEEKQSGIAWTKQGRSPAEVPKAVRVSSEECPGLYTIIRPATDCKIE